MKLSERSISALAKIVTGDTQISPYRSGPALVKFFNEFGTNDVYGQGFPSRWYFAEEKIRELNSRFELQELIKELFFPTDWNDEEFSRPAAVDYLNEYFRHDGYEIIQNGEYYEVSDLSGGAIKFQIPSDKARNINSSFITEQTNKCERKLAENDFDGAITNARSLLEAVFIDVEQELATDSPPPYDGDIGKLYKRVQKLLNLEPGREDLAVPLKQVLSGLSSIVSGIAGIRNKMGDAHVRTYKPSKRHAVLVVNSAKTLASFIQSTKENSITARK